MSAPGRQAAHLSGMQGGRVEASQFARGCAERLRSIEARLDYSCGSRWQGQLSVCDDLPSVARLLLPLQVRCGALLAGSDSGWLESLAAMSAAELETQSSELTRMVTGRLNELDRAVPPVRKPSEILGEVVFKQFKGHGTFLATVIEFDQQTGFRLQYDDGDTEDVSWNDLRTMMMPRGTGEARGGPPPPLLRPSSSPLLLAPPRPAPPCPAPGRLRSHRRTHTHHALSSLSLPLPPPLSPPRLSPTPQAHA